MVSGIEFTTRDGIVEWREVFYSQTGEKIVGPWEQTAPDLGFPVPLEADDPKALRRLYDALRSAVGPLIAG